VSDLYGFDLDDAIESGQCVLCHVVARAERRWLDSFWREGRRDPSARQKFYAAGGFCRRHAWLLQELVASAGTGAPIADVYGALANRDLPILDTVIEGLDRPLRSPARRLRRPKPCPACADAAEAERRKAHFLLEMLAQPPARNRYRRSGGLCFSHLRLVLEESSGDAELRCFVARDFRRRLDDLRRRLEAYERSRDHRYRGTADSAALASWTDVVRLYAGEQP